MVTIIPRGGAGGFTMSLPEDEKNYMTKEQLQNMLAVMLGGRAAEKVVLKDITTGASNDLKHVTDIARNMVVKYAMSENLPQMAFSEEENVFIANDIMTRRDHSERLVAEIDREIQTIVDHAYETALKIVEDNEVKLEELAKALVEYETLDDRDFILLMEEGYDALQEKIEADKAKTAPKLQPQVA
jgi:cell division protease FtsH